MPIIMPITTAILIGLVMGLCFWVYMLHQFCDKQHELNRLQAECNDRTLQRVLMLEASLSAVSRSVSVYYSDLFNDAAATEQRPGPVPPVPIFPAQGQNAVQK